jgi:hypothetical protein
LVEIVFKPTYYKANHENKSIKMVLDIKPEIVR